jgi:NAD(P)-dependent dehydrogenase (short-subunit alcohol dehydrogenase family)
MPRYPLAGKTALITGGARGIGLGVAQALAIRGAHVALVDLQAEAAQRAAATLGPQAMALAADVTDSSAIKSAVAQAAERFGGIDVVVANAGIAPRPTTMRCMDSAEFERVVEVDLLGVYRTVHAALPQIVQRRGHVVLVSSVYAFVNGILVSPYAASKAAVEQLGRTLRVELAAHGASATVAYFGFVDTPMLEYAALEGPAGASMQEQLPEWVRRRITPAQAGEAIAAAIERRRPRVIAPRYWAALSALRGIVNPAVDLLSARTPRLRAAIKEIETAAGGSKTGSLPSAPS